MGYAAKLDGAAQGGSGGASSLSQLTDVNLQNLSENDILVKKTNKWQNVSGYKRIVSINAADYALLTEEEKMADDIIYDLQDVTEGEIAINDSTPSSSTTYSSEKIEECIGFYTTAVTGSIGDTYVDITDIRIVDSNINVIEPMLIVPSGNIIGLASVVLDPDGESPNTIRITFKNALTEAITAYLHVTILGEDES